MSMFRIFRFRFPVAADTLLLRVGLLLAALLLLGVGGSSVWRLGGAPLLDAWRSRDWLMVEARLEDVSLDYTWANGARVAVLYSYWAQGRRHRAGRFGLHEWRDNADAQREAYADLLYRHRLRAWVNPKRPQEALLNRDIHWSVVLLALPALAAAGFGCVIFWAAAVGARARWNDRRRDRSRFG